METEKQTTNIRERIAAYGLTSTGRDVDQILIVREGSDSKALVAYRQDAQTEPDGNSSNSALAAFGNLIELPVFVCGYADDMSWFWPIPLNEKAMEWIPERDGRRLSELEWVTLLYELRGRSIPEEIAEKLKGFK